MVPPQLNSRLGFMNPGLTLDGLVITGWFIKAARAGLGYDGMGRNLVGTIPSMGQRKSTKWEHTGNSI